MRLIPILMIVAGVVLIMAARTDKDPRNIIFEALNIDRRVDNPEPIGGNKPFGTWVEPNSATVNDPGVVTVSV